MANASGSDTLTVTTVTVSPNPSQPVITVSGDTLFATPGFVSYEWYLDGFQIPLATGDTYVATANGNYQVTATDSNGCSASSAVVILNTGLQEMHNIRPVIYPNPAMDNLTIQTELAASKLWIQTGMGTTVFHTEFPLNNQATIDVAMLPKGCYMIRLLHQNGFTSISKFIKM